MFRVKVRIADEKCPKYVFGTTSKNGQVEEECILSLTHFSLLFYIISRHILHSCAYPCKNILIYADFAADTITALEFDDTGDYLATGDHGGRVVLFRSSAAGADYASSTRKAKKNLTISACLRVKSEKGGERGEEVAKSTNTLSASAARKEKEDRLSDTKTGKKASEVLSWVPSHQFQSHTAEFDYLKSLEIEAKVNQLKFLPSGRSQHMMLLSTNDKTIKLWKIGAVSSYTTNAVRNLNSKSGGSGMTSLKLPQKNTSTGGPLSAKMKRSYNNAHSYHVNTLTINSEGDSFASVDDLRINLWNFEDSEKCMNIIDSKPVNMEDLTEVFTCAAFHPFQNHTLAFSTSKGCIKVADLRISALCNSYLTFSDSSVSDSKETIGGAGAGGVFRELMGSISDLKFSADGRYMSTRDYLNIKIWDLHMTDRPINTIAVHPHLKPLLPQLYESESIFDKFLLNFCPFGKRVMTGSYNNRFTVRDVESGKPLMDGELPNYLDATKSGSLRHVPEKEVATYTILDKDENVRTDQRIVHTAWHPHGNMLAIAGVAGLHLYSL